MVVICMVIMMIASIEAMTYVLIMFIMDEQVDNCYIDQDFDQGHNPLCNHDYDYNFSQAYDIAVTLTIFQ